MSEYRTKCLIIGSGPAGYTAAIYASRAGLGPILISGETGGQLATTIEVENFPGFISIGGLNLMQKMQEHAVFYGTKIIDGFVIDVDFSKRPFICKTEKDIFISDSIIICTGATAKWLEIDSEKKFKGYGVSACAICDGGFFKNKIVAVIGGGNTALTEALYLTNHAKKVYIIYRGFEFKAEKIIQNQIFKNPKIEIVWNSIVEEIFGEEDVIGKFVTGIKIKNKENISSEIKLDGVFIAIGHKPNTDIFKGKIDMDEFGYIITKPGTPITNIPGIFAAGDVQDKIYKQAITSASTGCAAALEVENFLQNQ